MFTHGSPSLGILKGVVVAGAVVGTIASFSSTAQAAALTNGAAEIVGTGTRIVVETIPTAFEAFDKAGSDMGSSSSDTPDEDKAPSKTEPAGDN